MLVSDLLGQASSVGLLMQCPWWGGKVETLTTAQWKKPEKSANSLISRAFDIGGC